MSSKDAKSADILGTLERTLRGYIRFKLSLIDHKWWKSRVPGGIRAKCEKRKDGHENQWPWESPEESHPIAFADFDDYARIIGQKRNWSEVFKEQLGDRSILLGKLRELELARNTIAHNRPFPKDAEKQFQQNAEYMLKLLGSNGEFQQFISSIGDNWEELVESCREEDAILIVAGNPWLIGQDTHFKERNVRLGQKYPDLLFEDDDGFRTYVEVKRHQIDFRRIFGYADLLMQDLIQENCRLVWFIPETFKGSFGKPKEKALRKSRIEVIYYDIGFFTRWAFVKGQAGAILAGLQSDLSKPFRYAAGRKSHESFHYDFRDVCDALYFYGYIERDNKKTKTGFHLATLGWNLDLLRNLTAPNFRFMETNPDLVAKLVVEVLEYPYLYKDSKATPRQALRPMGVVNNDGFASFLEGYIKKGRITDIKNMVRHHHSKLREFYDRSLVPFLKEIRGKYPLGDPLLALIREDLLETTAVRVARSVISMGAIPAGGFRDGVIRFLGLLETTLTAEINVRGQIVRNTRVDEKGTYRANMAKRIVEIMALKRIIEVHAYIVPTYQILSFMNEKPIIQPVQTFKINKNAKLRRSYLR